MLNIRPLSPELAAKARNELNEVEARIPDDVAALRAWISKQPHLKARTDDQFLVNFLRGAKYSLEKAKQKIDYYYTIKTLSPEFFKSRPVDDKLIKLARTGAFVPLPKPLKADGPRIFVSRINNAAVNNEFTFEDMMLLQMRILEILIYEDDHIIIGGTMSVGDMSNISLRILLQFDPSLMKKLGVYTEKAIPVRVKGSHIISMPKEGMNFITLLSSIMPKKIVKRMKLHTSFDSIYEHIPKEYLPEEYGGTNGRIVDIAEEWAQKLIDHKEFFEDEAKYGVDEKLRTGTPITNESLFGLDGSFRKLEVD